MTPQEIDKLRDIALALKESTPELAFDIFSLILPHRPKGPALVNNHRQLKEQIYGQLLQSDIKYHCAFVPTEGFALLLTSFFKKKNESFILITPDNISISSVTKQVITEASGYILTESRLIPEVMERVSNIWVHAFGRTDVSSRIIKKHKLDYNIYSDGLKNELGKASILEHFPDYKKILTFGFLWHQEFLKKSSIIEVCTFQDIINIFEEVKKAIRINFNFEEKDHKKDWLFLRYWGQGKGEFKSTYNYSSVMKRYLSENNASEILIKGDHRVKATSTEELVSVLEKDFDIKPIIDMVSTSDKSEINIDNFFAEAIIPRELNGKVHVFDSSLSIYITLTTDSEVIFPSSSLIHDVFKDSNFAKGVEKYGKLYKSICDNLNKQKENNSLDFENFFVVKNLNGEFITSDSIPAENKRLDNILENITY